MRYTDGDEGITDASFAKLINDVPADEPSTAYSTLTAAACLTT
jgi:hypothetical protein